MPKNLTDANLFTSPVVVPEGSDSRDHAADDVEVTAQALTNRTAYLKATLEALDAQLTTQISDVYQQSVSDLNQAVALLAKLAVANVFTQPQQVDVNDAMQAALRTTKTAHDAPGFAGNGWKLWLEAQCDATRKVRLYSGANDPSGMFAITVNAYWQVGGTYNSKWRKDDSGQSAFGFMVTNENAYVVRQDTTDSIWSTWPSDQGYIGCNEISAGVGGLWSDGDVSLAGELMRVPGKARSCCVPIASWSDYGSSAQLVPGNPGSSATQLLCTNANSSPISIPLRVPIGCRSFALLVSHRQNGSLHSTFRIVASRAAYGASGGVFNDVLVVSVDSDAVFANDSKQLLVSAGGSHTVDSSLWHYRLQWIPGQVGDAIYGLSVVGWDDNQVVIGW